MSDQAILENLLLMEKGVCDLYMHGAIESAGTQNVHNAFKNALDDSLCMQGDLYKAMTAKGWVTAEQAQQQQMNQVKQKFASATMQ